MEDINSLKSKISELSRDVEYYKKMEWIYFGVIGVCILVIIVTSIIICKLKNGKEKKKVQENCKVQADAKKIESVNRKQSDQSNETCFSDPRDILTFEHFVSTPEITLDAVSEHLDDTEDGNEGTFTKSPSRPLSFQPTKNFLRLDAPQDRKYISTDTLRSVVDDCDGHKQFANIYDQIVKEKRNSGLVCGKDAIANDESQFENIFLEIK